MIHAQLIHARDRIVTDYGSLTPVREATTDVTAFPGGSGFIEGEPGKRPFMLLMHNYDGTDNLLKPVRHNDAFWLTLQLYLRGASIP